MDLKNLGIAALMGATEHQAYAEVLAHGSLSVLKYPVCHDQAGMNNPPSPQNKKFLFHKTSSQYLATFLTDSVNATPYTKKSYAKKNDLQRLDYKMAKQL